MWHNACVCLCLWPQHLVSASNVKVMTSRKKNRRNTNFEKKKKNQIRNDVDVWFVVVCVRACVCVCRESVGLSLFSFVTFLFPPSSFKSPDSSSVSHKHLHTPSQSHHHAHAQLCPRPFEPPDGGAVLWFAHTVQSLQQHFAEIGGQHGEYSRSRRTTGPGAFNLVYTMVFCAASVYQKPNTNHVLDFWWM